MSLARATVPRFRWACGAAARMLRAALDFAPPALSTKAINAEAIDRLTPCHTVNEQRVALMLPDRHELDQVLDMMAVGKNRTKRWLGDIADLDTAMPVDAHALDKREAGC
jgi:hypothetical protein